MILSINIVKRRFNFLIFGMIILIASCDTEDKNEKNLQLEKEQSAMKASKNNSEKLDPFSIQEDIDRGIKSVKIGNQVWMVENLNVDTFRNGDPVPNVETDIEWFNAGLDHKPAWSYYDNNSCYEHYGKLYNFYAVEDSRELAPEGWRIPTDEDWIRLTKFLEENLGDKLKSQLGWFNDGNGTNESGYRGYPGGIRDIGGLFSQYGFYGYWWTSSTVILDRGVTYYLVHDYGNDAFRGMVSRRFGMSIRCIRDYDNPSLPCD